MPPQISVGIDLGTTHCAMATMPLGARAGVSTVFDVPQLVMRGSLERYPLLPSFLYFAHPDEGSLSLPWDALRKYAVGDLARTRGAETPTRVVSSAKSWLSHTGIDRRASILPLGAPEDVEKVSPVEASFRYLDHMAEAWAFHQNHGAPVLTECEVTVTVPASFDAAARDLTTEAAYAAGMERLTLLEEPQAALYAWIESVGQRPMVELRNGDVVLVIDIGGGTTDFSAIAVLERAGGIELHRIAVGDHILLGGDNMDLALSHGILEKLRADGKDLDDWQFFALTHSCRAAKERLLADSRVRSTPVVIPARGSQLIGGTIRTELGREEVEQTLIEGFFPVVSAEDAARARSRAGLATLGLPYAADPAVTRHLAHFLRRHVDAAQELELPGQSARRTLLHPTCVLFNGGVVKAAAIRQRLTEVLTRWLDCDGAVAPRVLEGIDPDVSVARGAAYYGRVRSGHGLRIRGGTARAYYVGIESPMPAVPGVEPPILALCVASFGMEEGSETELSARERELAVVVGEPVRFRFFSSSTRRGDSVGTVVRRWQEEELSELAPIEIQLAAEGRRAGDIVPVSLRASVTAVGTLALYAVPRQPLAKDERWKVELNVRGAG
jgi:molecular chaperone DnaK (HSP70)